jgi:gluconate 2-dehydrogenase gamma chain
MTDHRPVTRRRFIRVSSLAAASGGVLAGCGRFQPSATFTGAERRLLEAIADQVIPPDQDAGGKDAGVGEFIDIQLRGPYRRHLPVYRRGLAKMDETSVRLHGRAFADLPFDTQTGLLVRLEIGQAPADVWHPGEAAEFFRLVTDHCMQGYYGSPRHGGNRGYTSWKMLKLDTPQVLGRVVT